MPSTEPEQNVMMKTSQNKGKEIECNDAMPVPPLLVKEQLFDAVETHLALSNPIQARF